MDKNSSHLKPEDWMSDPFLSEESEQEPLPPNEKKDSDAPLFVLDSSDAPLVGEDGCDAALVEADGCDDILFLCDDAEAEYGEIRDDENWESGFPRHNPIPRGMLVNGELPESKRLKPQNSRRSYSRDYCAPGFYLITATTFPGSLALSSMPDIDFSELKKGEMIIPKHSQLGELIIKEIKDIPSFHPELKVIRFVIMPDHIHFVLEVRTRLKRKLGRILAPFFGACSKHYMALCGLPELKTLFQPFNDRIIYNYPQLDRAVKYVEDNPRRLIIKRKFPDLFRRYLHLEIAGHEYAAYGNIFLLKEIWLLPVRIHRRWSEAEFKAYKEDCHVNISKGAIPISPAIHSAEKEILNDAIKMGSSVIFLTDRGFSERYKPSGSRFDLCAEGRLLLLAPWQDNTGRKSTSGYTEFHKMNDLALAISTLPSNSRLSLKSFPRS